MLSPYQVPTQIEKITYSSMSSNKSLSPTNRLELPHPSLPLPRRLMTLLCPIVLILFSTVDRLGDKFPMYYDIAMA